MGSSWIIFLLILMRNGKTINAISITVINNNSNFEFELCRLCDFEFFFVSRWQHYHWPIEKKNKKLKPVVPKKKKSCYISFDQGNIILIHDKDLSWMVVYICILDSSSNPEISVLWILIFFWIFIFYLYTSCMYFMCTIYLVHYTYLY